MSLINLLFGRKNDKIASENFEQIRDISQLSLFDPKYSKELKVSLGKAGYEDVADKINMFEEKYSGKSGLEEISLGNKNIPYDTLNLVDNVFLNKILSNSMKGTLEDLNGFEESYKDFSKDFSKKLGTSYKKRSKLLSSLENMDKWAKGKDVVGIKQDIDKINQCLKKEKSEKREIPSLSLLRIREKSLIEDYSQSFENEKGILEDFQNYSACVKDIFDSALEFDYLPSDKKLLDFHRNLTDKYKRVIEDEEINEGIKGEVLEKYFFINKDFRKSALKELEILRKKLKSINGERSIRKSRTRKKLMEKLDFLDKTKFAIYEKGKWRNLNLK